MSSVIGSPRNEMDALTVRVGETFGPHPDTKKLYYVYSLSPAAFYVAFVTVFLVTILRFATRDPFISFVVGPLLVVLPVLFGVGLYWIPK